MQCSTGFPRPVWVETTFTLWFWIPWACQSVCQENVSSAAGWPCRWPVGAVVKSVADFTDFNSLLVSQKGASILPPWTKEWDSCSPHASRNLSTCSATVACPEGSLLLWSLYAISTLHALNFPDLYKYFGDRKVWCKRGQVCGKKRSAPGHRCLCPSAYQHPKDESVKEREMGPQSLLKIYSETLLALAK